MKKENLLKIVKINKTLNKVNSALINLGEKPISMEKLEIYKKNIKEKAEKEAEKKRLAKEKEKARLMKEKEKAKILKEKEKLNKKNIVSKNKKLLEKKSSKKDKK